MKENYLSIFKSLLDLVCYVDVIVKNQERYYKYSIGLELREVAKEIFWALVVPIGFEEKKELKSLNIIYSLAKE